MVVEEGRTLFTYSLVYSKRIWIQPASSVFSQDPIPHADLDKGE
jgi:hypothetical protein